MSSHIEIVIFLSRSANNQNLQTAFTDELRSLGCNAILVPGNFASLAVVERAVESSPKLIRCVMRAKMLLKIGNAYYVAS